MRIDSCSCPMFSKRPALKWFWVDVRNPLCDTRQDSTWIKLFLITYQEQGGGECFSILHRYKQSEYSVRWAIPDSGPWVQLRFYSLYTPLRFASLVFFRALNWGNGNEVPCASGNLQRTWTDKSARSASKTTLFNRCDDITPCCVLIVRRPRMDRFKLH